MDTEDGTGIQQAEEETGKHTGRIGQVKDEDKCNSMMGGRLFPVQTDTLQDLR